MTMKDYGKSDLLGYSRVIPLWKALDEPDRMKLVTGEI
jgi:hypothetical protein